MVLTETIFHRGKAVGQMLENTNTTGGQKMVRIRKGRVATRKAFEPSQEQREAVIAMATVGLAHEKIARCVFNPYTEKPISPTTLYRHFRDELDEGMYDPVGRAILLLFEELEKGGIAGVMAAAELLKLHLERRLSEMDPEAQIH